MALLEQDISRFLALTQDYGYGDDQYSPYGDIGYGTESGLSDGSGDGAGFDVCLCSLKGTGIIAGSGTDTGAGIGTGNPGRTGHNVCITACSGYGSGRGYDLLSFNGHKVYMIDGMQTLIYQVRGNYAKGAVINEDLTLKPCFVARSGDFFGHGNTIHKAFDAANAKAMVEMSISERIDLFITEHPDLDKEYNDLFKWHNILTGSCEFGRLQWCMQHGYKPTDSITIRTFLDETQNDYGHEIIARLRERYGLN